MQPHRFFIAPFLPDSYYLVIKSWLSKVEQPLELDVVELVNCAQAEDTDVVIFDGLYDLARWVRSNQDGQPNLVSHVTFQAYFRQMAADENSEEDLPLRRRPGARDTYEVKNWPEVAAAGVIYKPRSYLHNRWPLRLGRGNRAGRAALLALFDVMTEDTPERAAQPVARGITLRQIRSRVRSILPCFHDEKHIGTSLRQLEQLGLIAELDHVRHNTTYQLNVAAFDRLPDIDPIRVAGACGLDPAADAAWGDLVCAFLQAHLQPVEEAAEVWRQIRKYGHLMETAEDARCVTEMVRQRQGKRSTGIARVLRDYQMQRGVGESWLLSQAFQLALTPGGAVKIDDIWMPALGGADVHLQATQLLLSVQCGPKVTDTETDDALQRAKLFILQGINMLPLTDNLRISPAMRAAQTVVDCNHLHRQLDYSQSFSILLLDARTDADVRIIGRFRVRRTLR